MKKIILLIISIFVLCSCQTQEESIKKQEDKRIEKIKENIKEEKIPESTKNWLIDTKTKKVLTILCISTSKKCEKIKKEIKEEKEIEKYYIEIDKISEEEKKIYKETYELNNYTGYLPYLILTNKGKLLNTKTDIYTNDIIKELTKKEQ